MSLLAKICAIHPSLSVSDFMFPSGTIRLQNDSDGSDDYIATWNHPTLAKPTDAQLAAAE